MAGGLTFDDFKPFTITCELRYPNAYVIYDRTGSILSELKASFTNINVSAASPQQTAFTSEEGSFHLELAASRFTSGRPDRNAESFTKHCKIYFDVVVEQLEIDVFSRIGLRYILRKEYKSLSDAHGALAGAKLFNFEPTKRFNSSESPIEVLFRWEDTQIGAFVRLKAETADVKVNIAPELKSEIPDFSNKKFILTLDIDYYTMASVRREQMNLEEWLPQKARTIRKEVDELLDGGKK